MPLARAKEALAAAQLCADRGLYASATSRAYYAMSWAAQAALAYEGIRRSEWSHPALQASFVGELIRRRKCYPVRVLLPSALSADEQEELANRMAEKSLDILLEEGFLILAGTEER